MLYVLEVLWANGKFNCMIYKINDDDFDCLTENRLIQLKDRANQILVLTIQIWGTSQIPVTARTAQIPVTEGTVHVCQLSTGMFPTSNISPLVLFCLKSLLQPFSYLGSWHQQRPLEHWTPTSMSQRHKWVVLLLILLLALLLGFSGFPRLLHRHSIGSSHNHSPVTFAKGHRTLPVADFLSTDKIS